MPSSIQLDYIKIETLPESTQCYQLHNGTIVYFKSHPPQRLYARAKGFDQVGPDAKLPADHFSTVAVDGNLVHVVTPFGSMYRAIVTLENAVNVSHVRKLQTGESVEASSPLCSRTIGSLKQVYRLGRNPEGRSVYDTTENGMLLAIHRNKLISVRCRSLQFGMQITGHAHSIRAVNSSVLAIELPIDFGACRVFAWDPSPIIYVSKQDCLFAFHTETMATQPMMRLNGVCNLSVFGVASDVIMLTGTQDRKHYLIEAKVPDAEFKIPAPGAISDMLTALDSFHKDQKSRQAVKRTVENSHNKTSVYYKSTERMEFKTSAGLSIEAWKRKRPEVSVESKNAKPSTDFLYKKEWQQELSETVNDLLDKNTELSKQIERQRDYKTENHQCANDFDKVNIQLESSSAELENENRYGKKNLQRKQRINDEIEAANDQLTEEHEMMVEEVEKTEKRLTEKIGQLRQTNSKLIQEKEQLTNNENNKEPESVSKTFKEDLMNKLKMLSSENKRLVSSLFERRAQTNTKKILEENEHAIKILNLKC